MFLAFIVLHYVIVLPCGVFNKLNTVAWAGNAIVCCLSFRLSVCLSGVTLMYFELPKMMLDLE